MWRHAFLPVCSIDAPAVSGVVLELWPSAWDRDVCIQSYRGLWSSNIIHPSTPRSPLWSPSCRFPHQDPIHPLSSPIRATYPAHLILLDFITRTILGEEYKSFRSSLCTLLHSPVTSSLLGPNILLNTMFSNTLSFHSSRNVNDQVSHPYKTTGKIYLKLHRTNYKSVQRKKSVLWVDRHKYFCILSWPQWNILFVTFEPFPETVYQTA